MNGVAIVGLAKSLAHVAHDGTCRKSTGEPYFEHVCRVADRVYGWKAKSVAYLHDTVEDTKITEGVLWQIFPKEIVIPVLLLTRKPPYTYMEYIDNLVKSKNDLALAVKLADLADNLSDLKELGPEKAASMNLRYTKAQTMILESLSV